MRFRVPPLQRALTDQVRTETEARLAAEHESEIEQAVRDTEANARKALGLELRDLREQLAEQERKAEDAEQQELALRKRARHLEEREKKHDIEIERRLDAERKIIEKRVREDIDTAQALKLEEKEHQIEVLRRALDEARRKSRQGSQERQGEVLQLDVEAALNAHFPRDEIRPVPKGTRGADLVHTVRNDTGQPCGIILWETKNTRHFQSDWIDKLKHDQRANGAALAAIVSVALPDEIHGFGRIDGVWIAGLRTWPALATALREQLIQVAYARAASEGKRDKMEILYAFLSGGEFRHRIEAIVEAFGGYCQVDVERANLSRRADFLCSHRTAQVTSCQTMKARSRSSR